MGPEINPNRCPSCGEPNACAVSSGTSSKSECWCMSLTIAQATLARIPADAKNLACICARCATAAGASSEPTSR